MARRLNLNADVGEGMGDDAALMPCIQSASIACGGHAGDAQSMRTTLRLARAHGVSVGAHPSYPDRAHFGRRRMDMPPEALHASLVAQIRALQQAALEEGLRIAHVKPHGALSNASCADLELARVVVCAIGDVDRALILLAPALSCLAQAGQESGLRVGLEAYADRSYEDDGQLRARSLPGAVLHERAQCLAHVQGMLDAGGLVSASGRVLPSRIDSVCVHGDTPDAVGTARHLHDHLGAAGWEFARLDQMLSG